MLNLGGEIGSCDILKNNRDKLLFDPSLWGTLETSKQTLCLGNNQQTVAYTIIINIYVIINQYAYLFVILVINYLMYSEFPDFP